MLPNTLHEPAFHVLTALAGRPQHGYTLIEDVARLSEGRVQLRTGTVYSILDRLREAALIEVDREEIVSSRLRRYYRLTDAGATLLGAECEALRRRANVADRSLRLPRTSGTFDHSALFYRDNDQYLAGTVPFVVDGLDAGEAVAVAVPTGNLALIRNELGRRASHVYMLDLTSAGRNPGRIISGVLLAFSQAHAGRRVRMIDEPVWPSRTPAEYAACAQHEALINFAFADQPATILCPYDAARLEPPALRDAARTHPILIDETGSRRSDAYAPHRVVDDHNLPLSGAELAHASVFEFNAGSVPQARAHAAAMAIRFGLPQARCGDVDRVVGELAANSVSHGGGRGRLRVWSAEGHVVCQVEDGGTLADPLAGRRPVPDHERAGRGLLIVNRTADLVRTHLVNGATTVRVYFGIAPQ